jgi:hypothetical protein
MGAAGVRSLCTVHNRGVCASSFGWSPRAPFQLLEPHGQRGHRCRQTNQCIGSKVLRWFKALPIALSQMPRKFEHAVTPAPTILPGCRWHATTFPPVAVGGTGTKHVHTDCGCTQMHEQSLGGESSCSVPAAVCSQEHKEGDGGFHARCELMKPSCRLLLFTQLLIHKGGASKDK